MADSPAPSGLEHQPAGFEILYEQGPCLIVSKPGGLLTQAAPGIDSLEVRVKAYIKYRDSKPGRVYLGVAHRLDRPASGAIALGKHQRAARRICDQLAARTVEKRYWALVSGRVAPESGTWRDHLRKLPDVAQSEVCPADHPEAREAVLHYRTLEFRDGVTWLEIVLETGRTHQIRVQAASRGHAILGDQHYGSVREFGPPTDNPRARCIALHARSLSLAHPMTRQPVSVTAPLPDYWTADGTSFSLQPSEPVRPAR